MNKKIKRLNSNHRSSWGKNVSYLLYFNIIFSQTSFNPHRVFWAGLDFFMSFYVFKNIYMNEL